MSPELQKLLPWLVLIQQQENAVAYAFPVGEKYYISQVTYA